MLNKTCSGLQLFLEEHEVIGITEQEILSLWDSLSSHNNEETFSQISEYKITYKDAGKLAPGCWLNDEIINSYLKLCKIDPNI